MPHRLHYNAITTTPVIPVVKHGTYGKIRHIMGCQAIFSVCPIVHAFNHLYAAVGCHAVTAAVRKLIKPELLVNRHQPKTFLHDQCFMVKYDLDVSDVL